MRRARFTEEQIVELLKRAESSGSFGQILLQENITKQTFQRWQKAFGHRLREDDASGPTTRTERTRAASEVNDLGVELAGMSPDDLDRLELPESLRDAIDLYQSLKVRSRVRQKRRVCQLLRGEDHEAIRERFDALVRSRPAGSN